MATAVADITSKRLTGASRRDDKDYDGTTSPRRRPFLARRHRPDDVTVTGGSATFGDKNVGTEQDRHRHWLRARRGPGGQLRHSESVADDHGRHPPVEDHRQLHRGRQGVRRDRHRRPCWRAPSRCPGQRRCLPGGGTATFDNKNVGTDKTVTLSGASLSAATPRQLQPHQRRHHHRRHHRQGDDGQPSAPRTRSTTAPSTPLSPAARSRPASVAGDDVSRHRRHGQPSTTRTSAPARPCHRAGSPSAAPTPATTRSRSVATTTADITAKAHHRSASPPTTRSTTAPPTPPLTGRSLTGAVAGDDVSSDRRHRHLRHQERRHRQDGDRSPASASPAPTPATTRSTSVATATADITATGDHRQLHRRQQGLRRQHRRHGHRTRSTAQSAGDDVSLTGGTATLRHQERRHRQDGHRHRRRPQRRRRRQLHPRPSSPPTTADITAKHDHRQLHRRQQGLRRQHQRHRRPPRR